MDNTRGAEPAESSSAANITEEIATNVAASIARADRSQQWVAARSGIPITTLGRKLRGHSDFTIPELVRIARAIDIPVSTLTPREFIRTEQAAA